MLNNLSSNKSESGQNYAGTPWKFAPKFGGPRAIVQVLVSQLSLLVSKRWDVISYEDG